MILARVFGIRISGFELGLSVDEMDLFTFRTLFDFLVDIEPLGIGLAVFGVVAISVGEQTCYRQEVVAKC